MRTCVGVEVLQVLQVCKFAFRFFLFPFFPAFVCVFVFSFFRFCRIICLYTERRTPPSVSLSKTKNTGGVCFRPVCKERLWIFFLFSPYAAAWPFSSTA